MDGEIVSPGTMEVGNALDSEAHPRAFGKCDDVVHQVVVPFL